MKKKCAICGGQSNVEMTVKQKDKAGKIVDTVVCGNCILKNRLIMDEEILNIIREAEEE